jgi:hypothetical protein
MAVSYHCLLHSSLCLTRRKWWPFLCVPVKKTMVAMAVVNFFYGCITMKKATSTTIAFFNGFVTNKAMATSCHLLGFVAKKMTTISCRFLFFFFFLLLWSFCYKEG